MTTEVIRIAQEYKQSGDLSRARGQLQGLDAANPTQWLIYLAESRIDEQPGAAETDALVWLAMALGLQSPPLMAYATQNNLLVNAPPAAESVADTDTGAAPAAVAVATNPPIAAPTPAPTVAPTVALAAAVTETTTLTTATTLTESAPLSATETTTQTDAATPAPPSKPMAQASTSINVRGGPGVDYLIVGAIAASEQVEIVAKNPQSDWWQVILTTGQPGWVYGPLVQTAGDTSAIAVAANIPEPPPTATPAPVAAAPTAEPAPAEQPPAEQPTAEAPAPVPDGPDFVLVEKRLWDVFENGGRTEAGSVTCGEKRELHVNVLDAAGNRLNNIAVQAIYGAQEIYVTGSQGKGDGKVEYVLGRGQGVKVIRDADGREATSDVADGMSTEPANIPYDALIGAQYCDDEADCKAFVDLPGCWGHYSWTVTFKRKY